MTKKKKKQVLANCSFCYRALTPEEEQDNKCYGCGHYICPECSANRAMPMGGHKKEDHRLDGDLLE